MGALQSFSICLSCCDVYPTGADCPACTAASPATAPPPPPALGVAAADPPSRSRTRRRARSRPLLARPLIPGRFHFLREHAALTVLAGLGLLFLSLAGLNSL